MTLTEPNDAPEIVIVHADEPAAVGVYETPNE
jgi:hypothetical protein